MLWLSKRPEWQSSREFETTTRKVTPGASSSADDGNVFGDDDENDLYPGLAKTRVVFQPTTDCTHTIFYKGHWLRVKRSRNQYGDQSLSIRYRRLPIVHHSSYLFLPLNARVISSVVARSNAILKQLVLQAKKEYEAESINHIQIYFADSHGGWRWTDSRHKRPMSSIVLERGVKEMLLSDTRDFLKSEKVSVEDLFGISYLMLTRIFPKVVCRPWYPLPSWLPPSWCPGIRQILPHPRHRW